MKSANKILAVPFLAAALAASGGASAQAYGAPYGAPVTSAVTTGGYYDYARVVRVVPMVGARDGYGAYPAQSQRCTTRRDAYAGDAPGGGYYGPDGRYYGDYYGETQPRSRGTEGGRTMASVLGTVIGAVVGSQVGGGSARYATAAIGSAVGGVAGRQVYDNAHRDDGAGSVTVCDPVDARQGYPAGGAYPAAGGNLYDVTYEYAGRTYTTRTAYDPGDRIRVRVDVRPE
ncbi:MAG TPA: glycine zipper domain-containing protein [Luteimonas sp.]|jgi:hypothetical protein|nr:glycine zipper domain-containing protein [Luteimonas sp.]